MDGGAFFLVVDVRVDVHREPDVRMAGEQLRGLDVDLRLAEVRDEGVPQAVEVGEQPGLIFVQQELARFAGLPFLRVVGLVDPERGL